MIVKVQISITGTDQRRRALIYNRDKSVLWEGRASQAVLAKMGGRLKAFMHATVTRQGVLLLNGKKGFVYGQRW